MPLTINVNGTSLRVLLQAQRDIIDACERLTTALSCAVPHPRDYPDHEDWVAARRVWSTEIDRVSILRTQAVERAQAILAQEGPEDWRRAE